MHAVQGCALWPCKMRVCAQSSISPHTTSGCLRRGVFPTVRDCGPCRVYLMTLACSILTPALLLRGETDKVRIPDAHT